MAYPYNYDNLTGIDLGECATFSHVLTDGIIDEFDTIELNKQLIFFAKYGSGVPKVSIINPNTNFYLVKDIEGTYSPVTTLYKFVINIPEKGTINLDYTDIWDEMVAIVKLDSDDSQLIFTRRVKILDATNKCATAADMVDLYDRLENMEFGIKQIMSNIITEVNENQIIIESKKGWALTI